MKKVLTVLLTIVLFVCLFSGTHTIAYAKEANVPSFIVGTAQGKRGDTVTVTVSVANNPGIVSLRANIGYDAKVLTLKSITGGLFSSTTFGPLSANPIAVNWVDSIRPNNTANGVVATLTFAIKENAPFGTSAVTVTHSADDVYDFDFTNVLFADVDGLVNVICPHKNTVNVPQKNSTCTEQGNKAHTLCNDCHTVLDGSDEKLPLAAHRYDNTKDTTCNVCGYVRSATTQPEVTSSVYTIVGTTIRKITAGTTVETLLKGINGSDRCRVFQNGKTVAPNEKIGTGMTVKVMNGEAAKAAYTAIVAGDTNGDGAITVTDLLSLKAHILKKSILTDIYATAGDTNADETISVTDFVQMKAKILGKGGIVAR